MSSNFPNLFQHNWRAFYDTRIGYSLFWLLVYLLTLALGSLIFFYQIPIPDDTIALKQVQFIASDASQPEQLPRQGWQQTTLPGTWKAHGLQVNNVWYRATVDLEQAPQQLQAILIPALKMNAAVYLNGRLLGSGGRFDDPVARNWMTPLLFSVPAGLLQQGQNRLLVRVKSDPAGSGQLDNIYIGSYYGTDGNVDKGLSHAYDVHYLFRISSIQLLTTMLLIMGALIGVLWLVRRKDSYYGYYALAVVVWGLHNFNIFLINVPVSTRLWDWWAYTSIGYYTMLATLFIHRFIGRWHPRVERWVIAIGIVFALLLLFPDDTDFYWLALKIWHPLVFALGMYILLYSAIEAWRRRSAELQLITATGAITLLYAGHDILLILGIADWRDGYYTQYASAVLLSVFSVILMRQFAHSLDRVDRLNRDLEQRVAEKGRQLEASFNKVREMENARLLAEERDRLTRDIHDGMGGHLVSTLALVESGQADMNEVADALKESLTDMRLMIDSMDIEEDDLNTLLGMFRMRIASRLENSRIVLEWNVSDLPPIHQFGPREALHILRILQEAITNIIRHTDADRISLATYPQQHAGETSVVIELRDNGPGMPEKPASNGHGLKNMARRAQEAGGKLDITSDASGTCVRIHLRAA